MARTTDDFWKLLEEIQGTDTDLTDSVKAIAKNEKTVAERLFTNIIDQLAYNSRDNARLRSFLRDWYAAHRSLVTYQANISDVYQMPNDQLDDLFQSFGYDLSASLRDPVSNTPPLNKINFFLDLVNLYKIKGTPQALVDVLKYYGIVDVDLYEMSLQYEDRQGKGTSDIIFKGKKIAGTTDDESPVYLPFDLLTDRDPHWLQTEPQIRSLVTTNKINFPSQTPYFTIRPLFDEEATDAATGMLQRRVQDQYDIWETAGKPDESTTPVLPQDAVVTITGDICSMLTLYLSCIYVFNKEFNVGAPATRFVCYDGTNTDSVDIIEEFRSITSKPTSRADYIAKYNLYLDTFSRPIAMNFLQDHNDAETQLAILNPTVKANLDLLATDNITVLGTLLRDLGEWVRANISYGFINMSYILFGIDSLFGQLRDVIEFFKPYRARLVPLEMIEFKNRLLNSIVVEDRVVQTADLTFTDYLIGDSIPCCYDATCADATTCIDAACSTPVSPREYYDCGSYHDIGAVVDKNHVDIDVVQIVNDYMHCPSSDTTGYVITEILEGGYETPQSFAAPFGSSTVDVVFPNAYTQDSTSYIPVVDSTNYVLAVNIYNKIDSSPSIMPFVITDKRLDGFTIQFSDAFDSSNYVITYDIISDATQYGFQNINAASSEVDVIFASPQDSTDSFTITVENLDDTSVSIFLYTITNKTVNGFTVKFSDVMPTGNYRIAWSSYPRSINKLPPPFPEQEIICRSGFEPLSYGSDSVTVSLAPNYEINDNYNIVLSLMNTDGTAISHYGYIVTAKDITGFTVKFSSPIDSTNYVLSWAMPVSSSIWFKDGTWIRQTGQFRDFDVEGTFDCTHGFDQVDIGIFDDFSFLLQENGDYLLQESGDRILL